MHSHLAIIGKNGELALNPDQSLNITDKNPMFNDTEMFSQTFQLPFDKNRHLLKNMEARDSSMRAVDVEGERFRIVMDGIPARTATLKVQDNVVLNDSIDVNLDATNRTFKDMIADLRCRDVPVDDDILVGEKVCNLSFSGKCQPRVEVNYHAEWYGLKEGLDPSVLVGYQLPQKIEGGYAYFNLPETTIEEADYQVPLLGFSYPGKCSGNPIDAPLEQEITLGDFKLKVPRCEQLFINTAQPYPFAKYCNSAVCYPHHDIEYDNENGNKTPKKDENGSYITSDSLVPKDKANPSNGYDFGPYWILPARRPASGICFYIAYFLERLFKKLGVAYDMSALTGITDFNYMCFFTTQCHVREGEKVRDLASAEEANRWLSSRGCGGQIRFDRSGTNIDKSQNDISYEPSEIDYDPNDPAYWQNWFDNLWQSRLDTETHINKERSDKIGVIATSSDPYNPAYKFELKIAHKAYEVTSWPAGYTTWYDVVIDRAVVNYFPTTGNDKLCVRNIYATEDNFPDVNVSEVIESLENSFGVRFCYDEERNKVTVRLLRDMFRNQQPPIPFKGKVTSMLKVSEKTKGVRMKYSAESDSQEQKDNVRYNKRDYDTTYNYIDYRADRIKFKAYNDWTKKIDIADYNCYVDMQTGDAFRVKVNSEAETATELKPSAFEVGQYKGVEIGDCSKENEDYIKEFVSKFEPVICNNIYGKTRNNLNIVPFVDDDMEHEFVTAIVRNSYSLSTDEEVYIYVDYIMSMPEAYDPTKNEDGQSPLMHHDWGLTVGILRPGRSGAVIQNYDYDYDGFGNSRWMQYFGSACITSDSYDVTGKFLGTNVAGSFSLKPRAYKPFRFYYDENEVLHISTNPAEWDDPKWFIPCNADTRNGQGVITARTQSRGMCDTFMIEFFRFLLYRQRYEVKAQCTAAELTDIPNHWLRRWEIDGKVGFINTVEYSVDVETGIGEVKIDFFAM